MLKPRRYRITPIGETWAEFLRAQGSRAGVPGELFSLITAHLLRCFWVLLVPVEMMTTPTAQFS